ncbi:hypothetical protein ACHAXT_003267 [Thalassiosira profunda]
MEDLFNMLSSAARLDKSKRKKKPAAAASRQKVMKAHDVEEKPRADADDDASADSDHSHDRSSEPRKKRPKKRHSAKKLAQIRREEAAAFRRRLGIRLSTDNRHELEVGTVPDPIASFGEWQCPAWWGGANAKESEASKLFGRVRHTILANIENGRWLEPTPIQMQAVPSLVERRDVMGCAPTGSGKTGAFVLPAIMLAKCSEEIYYGQSGSPARERKPGKTGKQTKKKGDAQRDNNRQGHVRSILLAPSRELAAQLHREVLRLSANMPGKFHGQLLQKSNAGLAVANQLGGKDGLDCLVATPLRLAECLERGMKLSGVRLVVLDEADRLLDASDGSSGGKRAKKGKKHDSDDSSEEEGGEEEEPLQPQQQQSGSSQSRTFLQQIDSILHNLPASATRALFSATLGPSVRHLSESILRSPIDITTGIHAGIGGNSAAGGASEHIQQELKFVGREEGKLLAIRQLVAEGITPPVLVFLQSKERAQALFGELLYDGIHVDVIHAGRSHAAREASVQKFRRGETWVLICTDLVARGVDFKAVNLVINYDLPAEGVTYVHRIGRTGRAGRAGRAITFFTEADFDNLRAVANVMRLSGCVVPEWMTTIKKRSGDRNGLAAPRRGDIDTTPRSERRKKKKRRKNKKGDAKKEEE